MTANGSSSSPTNHADGGAGGRVLDLLASGRLPPLPAAFLEGRDRQLLEPLAFLGPGELPAAPASPPDRAPLAAALGATNRAYGHPAADGQAAKLADPATRVVVTGQQPGLFGGPLYTLSKAVAAARWAAALEEAGQPAVAVFWVATEDHDFDEVARAAVPGRKGLRTFDLGDDPQPLLPVGARTLGPAVAELLDELAADPRGGDRAAAWWREVGRWYRPDARFGEAFSRLMTRLLGERCPLLLDSMLPELKAAQRPWLRRLVEERGAVEAAVRAADDAIEAAGYPLQVTPQPGLSPLFLLTDGERRRIEWRGEEGWGLRGADGVGGPVAQLVERIDDNPISASPGVLARPAIQDAVLGTSLLLLGPGELSYLPQAAAVYRALRVAAPAVALRPQVVVAESHQLEKLEQTGLDLDDLLADGDELERRLAARQGENPVEPVRRRIEEAMQGLRDKALEIDPNLERPWEKTRDNMLRGLDTFGDKLTASLARQDETQRRRIDQLRAAFLPDGKPQERAICSAYYPSKYADAFAERFYDQLRLDPRYLQLIEL
jgi:bacillithiol biosynthesis cysteine-adding enzyme BshC